MLSRSARVALAAVAVLLVGACGTEAPLEKKDAAGDKPDPDTVACRHKWEDLGDTVKPSVGRAEPSALADRWNSVLATIEYYAASGTADDCGDRLTSQKAADAALSRFEAKLRPYDVPFRYGQVRSDAQQYAARPAPKLPQKKSGPEKSGKKPPAPTAVAAAMKTLDAQAAKATAQQRPAWQQAGVVDLGDSAAVAKAVKDLAFLSSQSPAYRACTDALGTIDDALATTR